MSTEHAIQERLFSLQDIKYRDFLRKLIPNVDPNTVIGVRAPDLRKFAKDFAKDPKAAEFLETLPHTYFEENNLHGFLIERMADYEQATAALNTFLPYVDNWATCDQIRPEIFAKHLSELQGKIKCWMASGHTYTIRFGIEMLMRFYLDGEFRTEYLDWVSAIQSEEYYVNMMIAWFFATALTKQYRATLPYIQRQRLDPWTHNKAIQKAIESRCITDEQKRYLRTLKVKIPKTDSTEGEQV